jgi:hypothetical protein
MVQAAGADASKNPYSQTFIDRRIILFSPQLDEVINCSPTNLPYAAPEYKPTFIMNSDIG